MTVEGGKMASNAELSLFLKCKRTTFLCKSYKDTYNLKSPNLDILPVIVWFIFSELGEARAFLTHARHTFLPVIESYFLLFY